MIGDNQGARADEARGGIGVGSFWELSEVPTSTGAVCDTCQVHCSVIFLVCRHWYDRIGAHMMGNSTHALLAHTCRELYRHMPLQMSVVTTGSPPLLHSTVGGSPLVSSASAAKTPAEGTSPAAGAEAPVDAEALSSASAAP